MLMEIHPLWYSLSFLGFLLEVTHKGEQLLTKGQSSQKGIDQLSSALVLLHHLCSYNTINTFDAHTYIPLKIFKILHRMNNKVFMLFSEGMI